MKSSYELPDMIRSYFLSKIKQQWQQLPATPLLHTIVNTIIHWSPEASPIYSICYNLRENLNDGSQTTFSTNKLFFP
jgi:hypothetical protein